MDCNVNRWLRCAPQVCSTPIIITLPYICHNEADALKALIGAGAEIIHVRKPEASTEDLRRLLYTVDPVLRKYLTVHYNDSAAHDFALGGYHAFMNCGLGMQIEKDMRCSLSAHTFGEVEASHGRVDYLFISPIFNSISKQGYASRWTREEIEEELAKKFSCGVVALGGISENNVSLIRDMGFDGAALLGSVWTVDDGIIDIESTVDRYLRIVRKWRTAPRLMLISDGTEPVVGKFLAGGGRWVQLRMKDASDDEITDKALRIKEMCRQYGATFIVNDKPEIALAVRAHGVHLGRNDMNPAEARKMLGKEYVIGGTANTFEDVVRLKNAGVDYVGLGPFRYTTTKKNLSPLLGADGYEAIISRCRDEGIDIPVFAIGGILKDDIDTLLATGVRGIAVSGGIVNAPDPETETAAMCQCFKGR